MADVYFTKLWEDRSDARGFRFEFRCVRCHGDHMSPLVHGDGRPSAAWDHALAAAVQQIAPAFGECPSCRTWVCERTCWNHDANTCVVCTPVVAPPRQQSFAQTQAWSPDQTAALKDALRQGVPPAAPQQTPVYPPPAARPYAAEPPFGAPAPGQYAASEPQQPASLPKFCNQCGTGLAGRFCSQCGHKAY